MSKLQVVNCIDLNKVFRFYLDYSDKFCKNKSIAVIKIDENIEISVFEKDNIKRIFNSSLNKGDINFENLSLKEELNEITNQKEFIFIKNIISKLISKTYGNVDVLNKI